VNASAHNVGTAFTANSTLVNAAAINIVNQTNTATLYVTTSANVGTNITANSTQLTVTANLSVNGVIFANGSAGTAGQLLYTSGTGANAYWGSLPLTQGQLYAAAAGFNLI